jgi:hypothetical protein
VASATRGTCNLLPALRLRIPITLCAAAALAAPATAAQTGSISTNHGCYLVGQTVKLTGTGFAPSRTYLVTLDDVIFGGGSTNASGGFSASFRPGGLGANYAQLVDTVEATDGGSTAGATFTVTRRTGARFLAASGNARTLKAPFELWDFSSAGAQLPVYLHYIGPTGAVRQTVSLGRTGGQCGYLKTKPRRVFPFVPTAGTWIFQLDTHRGYARHTGGPVARIAVGIA